MRKYTSGVMKAVEEEKKEKNPKAACDSRGVREEQDEEVFGKMASWPPVATA